MWMGAGRWALGAGRWALGASSTAAAAAAAAAAAEAEAEAEAAAACDGVTRWWAKGGLWGGGGKKGDSGRSLTPQDLAPTGPGRKS